MSELSSDSELLETCFKFLILGVIQGITEFLPISSTAHLKALPTMLGWNDPGLSITAVIQLGSVLAVITYFQKDLQKIIKSISLVFRYGQWKEENAQLGLAICTGTLPILLTGMSIKLFWSGYEDSSFRSIPFIAFISILMAFLLAIAETIGTQRKTLTNISGKDGFIIGLGQALAILPGVSRSGITLTTALIDGWKREDAARFSFLIGIPAITFAGLAELKKTFNGSFTITEEFLPLLIGIAAAAIVSWIVIDWLLQYLQKNNTWLFIIYRLLFGVTLLVWWLRFRPN